MIINNSLCRDTRTLCARPGFYSEKCESEEHGCQNQYCTVDSSCFSSRPRTGTGTSVPWNPICSCLLGSSHGRVHESWPICDLIDIHYEEPIAVASSSVATEPRLYVLVVRENIGTRDAVAESHTKEHERAVLCCKATLADRFYPREGIVG